MVEQDGAVAFVATYTVTTMDGVSIVQPDYTAEVLAARNAGAEVVVTVMDARSMIRVIRSAQRQSWKPIFSATHNLNSESFKTTDADLTGTLAASTTVPHTTSPRLVPYREAMQRYQPGAPLGGYGGQCLGPRHARGTAHRSLGPGEARERRRDLYLPTRLSRVTLRRLGVRGLRSVRSMP